MVIATYKRPASLRDTLRSLVNQVRPADEVVVVDNNSLDETEEVVAEFRDKIPLKYRFESRQGVAFARNAALAAATGDIIAFTDDDCVTDPHWLYYLELPFLRDPSIGMAGGEIGGLEVQGSIVERFCIADAMLRIGGGEK